MIFDLLTPPQGPRGRGKKIVYVARPIHVSNSHTKFGWISSNGLGGDSITDGQTDGDDNNIAFAFLKKRGDNKRCAYGKAILTIGMQLHAISLRTIWSISFPFG